MKRGFAPASVLIMLAPLALVVAGVCSADPCCGTNEVRIVAAMPCCAPATICADSSDARQTKAVDAHAPLLIALHLTPSVATVVPQTFDIPRESSSPPPVRVRLALISTLLI